MDKRNINYIILAGVLVLAGIGCKSAPVEVAPVTPGTTARGAPAQDETAALTMENVARHSRAEDCWLVIDGAVYDVTDFIPYHPGRAAIIEGCGTDATDLFETRPMGSGTPHSENARSELGNYYIGDLE